MTTRSTLFALLAAFLLVGCSKKDTLIPTLSAIETATILPGGTSIPPIPTQIVTPEVTLAPQPAIVEYKGIQIDSPSWSPDSAEIAMVSGRDWFSLIRLSADMTQGKYLAAFHDALPPPLILSASVITQTTIQEIEADRKNWPVISPYQAAEYSIVLPETTINPVGAAYCKPAWSPVGDRIAFCFFSEDAPNTSGIYVIDRDGQNMKPLITPVTEIRGLDWSSDGKQLLYTKDAGDGGEDIWVCMANVDGSQEKLIKKVHHLMGVTLSPDSSKIAYIVQEGLRGGDLYIMNSDGSNINNLTKTEDQESESSPSWSPDGKRLVYIGNACDSVGCYDSLYVINADGTDKKLITRGYFYFENVSWSPDGEWLLLVARKSNPQGTGSDDVLIKWKVDF